MSVRVKRKWVSQEGNRPRHERMNFSTVRPHVDEKEVNKLTRSLVSTSMFAPTEGSIAELTLVFLLGRCRDLLGRC